MSPFPHRTIRDKSIKTVIGEKDIPLHKIRFKKSYEGEKIDKTSFHRWAFVPFKEFRSTINKKYNSPFSRSL